MGASDLELAEEVVAVMASFIPTKYAMLDLA